MLESEKDLIAKMLRAVLQANKHGVPFPRVQSEYKSLTGEWIPFKEMGFQTLEAYLKTIPTVVRIDINRTGEVTCHAVVCKDTAQIAELVARQRNSKKKSGGQVNCQMRLKYSAPITHIGKPKAMLRKPGFSPPQDRIIRKPVLSVTRGKANVWSGRPSMDSAHLHIAPMYAPGLVREVPMLKHPPAARLVRKVNLPPRFQTEVNQHMFPPLSIDCNANDTQLGKPALLANFQPNLPVIQSNLRDLFSRHSNGIPLLRLQHVYKETFKHDLSEEVLKQVVNWTHVCTVQRTSTNNGQSELILFSPSRKLQSTQRITQQRNDDQVKPNVSPTYPKPVSSLKQNENTIPHVELKQKVSEILTNYSNGLWSGALPKVFEDTFKIKFPSDALNLDALSDICTINVISENPYKAILYAKTTESEGQNLNLINIKNETHEKGPSNVECWDEEITIDVSPPPLVIPSEASPSVLVVELINTEEVVIRYVGKDYSAAQELMEDEMKEFYSKNPSTVQLCSLRLGQLVAVKAEEDAWLRAQISSIEDNKIRILYVDYGFSEVVDCTKVSRLDKQFYSLPFQATKCRLAGLEAFCDDPVIIKAVEAKACSKILAVEVLEKTEKPLVILYDTSGDDDININAVCLRELCDTSLTVQLKVNSSYINVFVTNVCSDGTLFCQVQSKGLTKLKETLQKIEHYFNTKTITSELFVSLPFCGKICLFYGKGKWARVEITSVHSSRALDVQFLDSGTISSVKVSELREIPSPFLLDIISIPPQATRCCLADLPLNIGMCTPDAVLWLRNTVLNCSECSIKVVKIDDANSMVYVYLFTSKNCLDPDRSVNRQIANEELWKQQKNLVPVTASGLSKGRGDTGTQAAAAVSRKDQISGTKKQTTDQNITAPSLDLPPPLPLPKSGEHMDIFVSVACHPGHFVFQPWQELHKLEVLMEEMLLHYSTTEEKLVDLEKNKLYTAKVDKKWYRVLLKGILTNGLVSVYVLDYGRHELVNSRHVQPLIDKFKLLPFQAVTSQLAGVKCEQWSEEASIVFRNHVEKKPLVALIQSVQEGTLPWDRKVVAYIVDTALPDTDIWIHDLMSEYLVELSKPE